MLPLRKLVDKYVIDTCVNGFLNNIHVGSHVTAMIGINGLMPRFSMRTPRTNSPLLPSGISRSITMRPGTNFSVMSRITVSSLTSFMLRKPSATSAVRNVRRCSCFGSHYINPTFSKAFSIMAMEKSLTGLTTDLSLQRSANPY